MRVAASCFLVVASFLTLWLGRTENANADTYPASTMHFIVPYATGGSVDAVARMLANELSNEIERTIVVENRVGASGNIAAAYVAKANPDGTTFLVHNAASVASNVNAFRNLTFDPRTDLTPVAIIAMQPGVLVIHPDVPASNLKEFIDYAKSQPDRLNYGVGGVFGPTHTPAVLFGMRTGVVGEPVMYRGAAPAILDLVGGRLDYMFDTAPTSVPHIKSGKLRALAATSMDRIPSLPDVPTMDEMGVSGYEYNSWIGLSAPAGTSPALLDRLNKAIINIISSEQFQERLSSYGLNGAPEYTPSDFKAYIDKEVDFYADIIRESGIPPLD